MSMFGIISMLHAQTDMTSYIVNPDFEEDPHTNGWTRTGFGPNSGSFSLKHGNTFVEMWGGHGSTLSDASIYQIVDELPPGTYTVTVAAHNIQQGNNDSPEKGAFVFAGESRTEFGAAGDYSATCLSYDGTLRIGVVLEGCTGNWVALDNFRLSMKEVASDLRPYIQPLVDEANKLDQHNSSSERNEMIAARDALLKYLTDTSLNDGISAAFVRLKNAIKAYSFSIASETNPYDMTEKIINPSFEGSSGGWTATNMSVQGNEGHGSLKVGSRYMEHWEGEAGIGINCSVLQTVTGLPAGDYILSANAFNITQNNESQKNIGAYVVGDTKKTEVYGVNTYNVRFTLIGGSAKIGFECRNATGNWVAVDNFKLYYLGFDDSKVKSQLSTLINDARSLVGLHMSFAASQELDDAITQASSASTLEAIDAAAARLKPAISTAEESISKYKELADAISSTSAASSEISGNNGKAEMEAALSNAQSVYNNLSASDDEMSAAIASLEKVLFMLRVMNGSGEAPEVTCHPDIIYGSHAAVGRMDAKGSNIIECGFCWSTEPNPTVLDNHSSQYYEFNGKVYFMPGLEPATKYYFRAYAMTKTYAVGYGPELRIITGYDSDIEFGFNYGAPTDEENQQCIAAMETSVQYLRDWTSIRGYRPFLNYEIGKWGADCSYGGWISAGESYARNPGVMMHEMGHGIGVGQHWRYTSWDSPLHPTMYWTGERANRVFAFFENQPDVYNADGTFAYGGNHTVADGDRVHVCYGLSGVTSPIDLLRQAAFYQGMYEDGMPATNDGCCPFYSFESEDGVKYYLTNEKNGAFTRFLTEGTNGRLNYKAVSVDEATSDDAYAWYITYQPTSGFYHIQNVKSGNYFTWNGTTFVTKSVTKFTMNEDIHLMPCRYNAEFKAGNDSYTTKTYWMGRGNRDIEPEVLATTSSGTLSQTAPKLNFYDDSKQQHWALMSAEDLQEMSQKQIAFNSRRLEELIAGSRNLLDYPHEFTDPEEVNVDSEFSSVIETTDAKRSSLTTIGDYNTTLITFMVDIEQYLQKVQPVSVERPFDLSFLLDDCDLETGSSWEGLESAPANSVAEFKTNTFALSQSIQRMPTGTYSVEVNGFQSPGKVATACKDYNKGTNNVSAYLNVKYNTSAKAKKTLPHIYEGGQPEKLDEGGIEYRGYGLYFPFSIDAAIAYLNHGFYKTSVVFASTAKTITISVEDSGTESDRWTVIDGIKILYYGTKYKKDDVTSIDGLMVEDPSLSSSEVDSYYTMSGVKISSPLEKGITIVKLKNGETKKIYLRK